MFCNRIGRLAATRACQASMGSFGLALALHLAPSVQAAEHYPIWFSPALGIESVDQVDTLLDARLFGPNQADRVIALKRAKSGAIPWEDDEWIDESAPSIEVATCRAFLTASDDRYAPFDPEDRDIDRYFRMLRECEELRRLEAAGPAVRSFVRDFTLDAGAPDVLPATMSMPINCETGLAAYQAHQGGLSWAASRGHAYTRLKTDPQLLAQYPEQAAKFQRIFVERRFEAQINPRDFLYKLRIPEEVRYDSEGSSDTVSILARADFNGDGLEDLMIKMVSWARGGTLVSTNAFIVTRASPNGVMRDLDPEFWVCERYWREIDKGRRSDGSDHPVWLSSALGIERLAEVDRHLAAPFAAPLERLLLYKAAPGDGLLGESPTPDTSVPPVEATTCQAAIEVAALGYVAFAPETDAQRHGPVLLQACRDIATLKDARPAPISLLQTLGPFRSAPDNLPSFFQIPRSCTAAVEAFMDHGYGWSWNTSANPGGFARISGLWARLAGSVNLGNVRVAWPMKESPGGDARAWRLYEEGLAALPGSEGHVSYITGESSLAIAKLAKADFDGDGWQDVMLSLRYREHRPGARTRVLTRILTRDLPRETLRDLKPEDWLCPEDFAALAGSMAVRSFGLR